MTTLEAAARPARHDLKVMSLIGTGHFFSHFYILLLPPLFPLLKEQFGVGYVELGFALAVLNGTTGLTQAPVGFLVDRFGARGILITGLTLFSLGIGLVGVWPSYPVLLLLMVVAGLGNSVFHPADYAILSAAVDGRRMGRAFSIHTFGGYAGFALAPPVIVGLTALVGWQLARAAGGRGRPAGRGADAAQRRCAARRRRRPPRARRGRRRGRRRLAPAAEPADPDGAAVLRDAGGQPGRLHDVRRQRDRGDLPGRPRRGDGAAHRLSRRQRGRRADRRLDRRSHPAARAGGRRLLRDDRAVRGRWCRC